MYPLQILNGTICSGDTCESKGTTFTVATDQIPNNLVLVDRPLFTLGQADKLGILGWFGNANVVKLPHVVAPVEGVREWRQWTVAIPHVRFDKL